ncbi:MAG: class I SAM-dependent methyltransferase [Gemmatimonadaceae bacterium]
MDADLFATHARMEDAHWWFRARQQILNAILRTRFPPGRKARLLDVGCGTGGTSARFPSNFEVVGVEPSEPAVELARKRFPQIEFVAGLAPDAVLDHARNTDIFVLTDVLEHIEHDRSMVERLVKVAKPDALFLTTVPANEDLWTEHDVSHGHYRRYTLESFGVLWQNLPVEVKLLSYYNYRLYPLVYASRRISQLRRKAASHNDTDLSLPPAPLNRALEAIFAGEARRIVGHIDAGKPAYERGVSIIALFQKREHVPT